MKKFLNFLSTVLTEKRETTVGYRIYNLLLILMLLFGVCTLTKDYYEIYLQNKTTEETLEVAYKFLENYLAEEDYTIVVK